MTDNQAKQVTLGRFTPFVDFKGWRFYTPFRCLCCGKEVSIEQFCFGRACGSCDCGHCRHPRLPSGMSWSGPREIMNRYDSHFIEEHAWINPPDGKVDVVAIHVWQRVRELYLI